MKMPAGIQIVSLADAPQHLPTVARWQWETWGKRADQAALTRQEAWLQKTFVDTRTWEACFLAVWDEDPVGTASLVADDGLTGEWIEIGPWLASVFVAPPYRGRGIATALVKRVVQAARDVPMDEIFLYTPDQQALYRRLGYETVAHSTDPGGSAVDVMRRFL